MIHVGKTWVWKKEELVIFGIFKHCINLNSFGVLLGAQSQQANSPFKYASGARIVDELDS